MAANPAEALRTGRIGRWISASTRLLGPQTSSAARERRDTLVLLFAVALVVVPHFEHLPWWATSVVLLLLVWRVWLTVVQRPLPGRFIMLPLLLAAGGAVYLQHRTLAGQDAGVTFLLLLMALKLLEMRARRDIFVVIFLAFFILLTQFLYGQELQVAAITVVAVMALFFVLVSVNLDEVDLPATRKLRLVGLTLVKAIPLTAALFFLFPRLSGPLWGMPGESRQASTGLSNSMSPGSISRLLESDDVVFRARFEAGAPMNDKLYWRGPVFGTFNGRTWTPLARRLDEAPAPLSVEPVLRSGVDYEITLEPHKRDWLFALEAPAAVPSLASFQVRLTPDMQMLAAGLVTERLRYQMRSHTEYRLNARATPAELQGWLELPKGFNPRTLQFADELKDRVSISTSSRSASLDAQFVAAVLDHFRRGGYRYTLSPPALGRNSIDDFLFDTRLGFCEHYAAAFVFMMRAMGVPARVVTGYQGGETNPVDGYMTVRQSDAHAWTEVWLNGRGWVRIDPTATVAPVRIERGAAEVARQSGRTIEGLRGGASWLQALRYNWEAVQNGWNQWVLSYSQEQQRALVERFGLMPTLQNVALVLAIVMGLLLAWLAVISLRPRTVHDPLGAAFALLRDRLEKAGVAASVSCGPRELYARSRRALVDDDVKTARRLLSRYERLRYGPASAGATRTDIRALRRAIRAFRPRPNPL
jgi:transglutaminase-like putative cysteine protease